MITHRQVETFRAVMVSSNMTEAGRVLSVTQSAISKIMKEFENEVGFPLFRRRKGGLQPTPEARALYEEVERSYRGLDKIAHEARRVRHREVGKLEIGSNPAITSGFIQRVIRQFREEGHDINASLHTYNSVELVDLIVTRRCDFGFVMTPIDTDAVSVSEVLNARCVCLLPRGHRLARKKTISITDLEGEEFISLAEGTSTRHRIDALFNAKNVNRKMTLEARWSVSVAGFVAEGLGCTIIEPFSAIRFAEQGGIVKPLQEEILFSFAPIFPKHGLIGGVVEDFIACFRREFEKFDADPVNFGARQPR